MYLTHDEFVEMGGSMDAAHFARYETKARNLINVITHDRLRNENPVRDVVRYCMFELISGMQSNEAVAGPSGREVASMSNDGVSVTFATGTAQSGVFGGYSAIVRAWLLNETDANGTPLMYAGVCI